MEDYVKQLGFMSVLLLTLAQSLLVEAAEDPTATLVERAKKEMDDGIASVTAALGDGTAPAPFFRIPGLARADAIEEYAASKGIQVWSADFLADDWRHVSPQRVYDLAIQRLEAKGKGILLLHDIQARTVAALPRILRELKARGYRIVHVVPATSEQPATPTEPQQWQLNPASEMVATSRWPKIPGFVYAQNTALPAPDLSDFDWQDTAHQDRAQRRAWRDAQWSRQVTLVLNHPSLPVPAASVFKLPESVRVTMLYSPPSARPVERTAQNSREGSREDAREIEAAKLGPVRAGKSRRQIRTATVRHPASAKHAAHQPPHAGKTGKGAAKHAAQAKPINKPVKKNAVRVAGLKKR